MSKGTEATETAKRSDQPEVVTLSTGIRARIVPVAASLVEDVMNAVPEPEVPTFMNEQKGREEPNPHDPSYQRAMRQYERERNDAAMSALVLFGLELEDGVPDDDTWLKKLQFIERRTQLDLSGFDLNDELDQEFVYKRYIACGTMDLITIGRKAGLSQEDVQEAVNTFPGT